MDIENVGGV